MEIEPHLYLYNEKMLKRFFDKNDIYYFFKDFEIISLEEDSLLKFNNIENKILEKKTYKVCVKNSNKQTK